MPEQLDHIDVHAITRALISVYDKTGIIELAQALADSGAEIVSTGSTAATMRDAGIPVTPVEQVTGFPECLEGRVKTLHPRIHAGILADQRKASHREQLQELEVAAFDLVVCNLYPFEDTVASGASVDECVEQIDIGGPSMVRAAAKNHPSVAVITSPARYDVAITAIKNGGFTFAQRRALAMEAFAHTAAYDTAISAWGAQLVDDEVWGRESASTDIVSVDADVEVAHLPHTITITAQRQDILRYGENPHQAAAVYTTTGGGLAGATQLSGKPLSFNNYTDADAALRAAYDHERPCVAIIKHANPCGIAVADTVAEAHRNAHACDPVSAFGGVIAVNRPVSVELAEQILPIFTEVVIAPGYEEGAAEVLASKKNLRVLQIVAPQRRTDDVEVKHISGGLLIQNADYLDADGDTAVNWTLVAGEAADSATLADLEFAWRSVRAVRSNAILLAKDGASVGVGMGQVNRVDSCKLAIERANTLVGRETGDAAQNQAEDINSAGGARGADLDETETVKRSIGAVAASDAFFPFADGLQLLIDAGVKAVVQPGGSVRDQESIDAAKAAGITMYLTGVRHFAH